MKKILLSFLILLLCSSTAYSASFTITVPDEVLTDFLKDFSDSHDYDSYVAEGGTDSRTVFSKRKLKDYIFKRTKNQYKESNSNQDTLETESNTKYSGIDVE